MALAELVSVSAAVAGTRSRLKKREFLAACLKQADAAEIGLVVNYLSGTLPQGKIGLGPSLINAMSAGSDTGPTSLNLAELNQSFNEIAATSGAGSAKRRSDTLTALYQQLDQNAATFVSALVLGELRQGALEALLIEALADASDLPVADVRRAVMLSSNPARVAEAALAKGAKGLEEFQLTLFKPVKPMLAQPAETMAEAIETLGTAALEKKLDGARVQIHLEGQRVEIYTRQLNDVTLSLPDIVESVRGLELSSAILDGEVLALGDNGRPLPFQVTMRRFGRRKGVDELLQKIPLQLFVFDCLMLNGASLIDLPLSARILEMEQTLPPGMRVERLISEQTAQASQFLTRVLDQGHEGVMAKSLSAPYMAGSRGADWLKIKQAHTLDLVVLAAEWGSGRRQGKLSNLHLGARDDASGELVMLGKTFKGLSDRMLQWQTEKLLALETHRTGQVVYVAPELVVEIAFSDVQTSRQYPAQMALRFARVKAYRSDKGPSEADTVQTVRAIHQTAH